jgi:hypothetical protein
MKLSKSYSFKKSKCDEIISFIFPFINAHSKIRREKRQHQNGLFAHEGRLFPSEIREKRPEYDNFGLFLRPSIIALYKKRKQSLCLFSNRCIYRKFICKKGACDKISEDINVGESVLMNVAPLYL